MNRMLLKRESEDDDALVYDIIFKDKKYVVTHNYSHNSSDIRHQRDVFDKTNSIDDHPIICLVHMFVINNSLMLRIKP